MTDPKLEASASEAAEPSSPPPGAAAGLERPEERVGMSHDRYATS